MRASMYIAGIIGLLNLSELSASFGLCGSSANVATKESNERVKSQEAAVAVSASSQAAQEKSCLTIKDSNDVVRVMDWLNLFFKENSTSIKALVPFLTQDSKIIENKEEVTRLINKIWNSWTVIASYFRKDEDNALQELGALSDLVWKEPKDSLFDGLSGESLDSLRALVNDLASIVNITNEVL